MQTETEQRLAALRADGHGLFRLGDDFTFWWEIKPYYIMQRIRMCSTPGLEFYNSMSLRPELRQLIEEELERRSELPSDLQDWYA